MHGTVVGTDRTQGVDRLLPSLLGRIGVAVGADEDVLMVIEIAGLDVLVGRSAAADARPQASEERIGFGCMVSAVNEAQHGPGSGSSSPPRSKSASVARIEGSTVSIRATALRDSRGNRRKIESAAPALYVVSDEMDSSRGRPAGASLVALRVGDGGSDASGAWVRTCSSERRTGAGALESDVDGRDWCSGRGLDGGEAGTVNGSFSGASAVGIGREKTRSAADSFSAPGASSLPPLGPVP